MCNRSNRNDGGHNWSYVSTVRARRYKIQTKADIYRCTTCGIQKRRYHISAGEALTEHTLVRFRMASGYETMLADNAAEIDRLNKMLDLFQACVVGKGA